MSNFPLYQNPQQSRLEQWRNEITEMRSKKWPYPAIAKWLLDEQQLEISTEAIRQFCQLRNIRKGNKTNINQEKSISQKPHEAAQDEERFTYESRPINLHER